MQAQQAPLIFAESERPIGERLLKLALETDRVEGYTEPHAVMIARLAETVGRQLGLHGHDLSALKFAALAHDIGERGMKRNYLLSPNTLTWEETLDLWRHPILGEQSAADLRLPRQTQLLIRWHHEWWSGQGYPDGLANSAIPLGARILRAVDSYCALISRRPHREAFSLAEAEQIIADQAGIEFDPQVVKLLLAIVIEERKQREAESWNVEPEPDLQYVFPGYDNYDEPVESVTQSHFADSEIAVTDPVTDSSQENAAQDAEISLPSETLAENGEDFAAHNFSATPPTETIEESEPLSVPTADLITQQSSGETIPPVATDETADDLVNVKIEPETKLAD